MARLQVGYDPSSGKWLAKVGDDVFLEVTEGAVGCFGVSTAQAGHIDDATAVASGNIIDSGTLGATVADLINGMNTNINAILVVLENLGLTAKS